MKALNIVHYPIFGGPHNRASRLAEPLLNLGWQTLVLVPDEPGNAAETLRARGVDVIALPLSRMRATLRPATHLRFWSRLPGDIRRIRNLIREREVDLVVIGGLANPHGAIAAYLEHKPVVWQIVDSRTPRLLRFALMPMLRRLADAVMVNGESLARLHFGDDLPSPPPVVYYPPVDTDMFKPSPELRLTTRQQFGFPPDALVIGMVANLNPQKGIEYFVRAAVLIRRKIPDARFMVIGARYETHWGYTALIESEIEKSEIPGTDFILAGERMDIERFYPAMDIKLITSVPGSEGTTTTAMEAMSCGLPIVATDVGAVKEVVEDGVTGFVVTPCDPEAIAQAALRLLEDAALRASMGHAAHQIAKAKYDVASCAETHRRAFELAIVRCEARVRAQSAPESSPR